MLIFKPGQNLSNQEKKAPRKLKLNKNNIVCINDTDKNLGATNADTSDVKTECCTQLYDTFMYNHLFKEATNEFIRNVKFQFKSIVEKHLYRGSCSFKEAKLMLYKGKSGLCFGQNMESHSKTYAKTTGTIRRYHLVANFGLEENMFCTRTI